MDIRAFYAEPRRIHRRQGEQECPSRQPELTGRGRPGQLELPDEGVGRMDRTDAHVPAEPAPQVRVPALVGPGIVIELDARGGDAGTLQAQWLVNATGIETRAAHFPNPLLQAMLQAGHARPGPHGLGIDTDVAGEVVDATGSVQPRIAAIGSLRLGTLWETTAVPDLRVDAALLASRWLAAAASG